MKNIKGKNNPNYIDGRSLTIYLCKICKVEISYQSAIYKNSFCRKCSQKQNLKHPLAKKYKKSLEDLAKQYNVGVDRLLNWWKNNKNFKEESVIWKYYKQNKYLQGLLFNINSRCNNKKDRKFEYYGGKGIKNFLTKKDIVYLWIRDRGFLLKQPSIDRKNSNKNYTRKNCRFIELENNRSRSKY